MNDRSTGRENALAIIRLNGVDLVTLVGLVVGLAALLAALRQQVELALGLLFLAVLCDAFDGVLARRFGQVRDFGRYLDGFVDCIIYMIVPSVLFYTMGFDGTWQLVTLAIFVAAGLIRLSVFNQIGTIQAGPDDERAGMSYLGLPVFWAAFVAAGYYPVWAVAGARIAEPILAMVLLLYSVLMLHNAPYWKPRNKLLMLGVICGISVVYFWLAWRGVAD